MQSVGTEVTERAEVRIPGEAGVWVAFVKVRLVGLDYMELRAAPVLLRYLFEAWILVVMLAIILISRPAVG